MIAKVRCKNANKNVFMESVSLCVVRSGKIILIHQNNGLHFSALSMNLCSHEDTLLDYSFSALVIHGKRADVDIWGSGVFSI